MLNSAFLFCWENTYTLNKELEKRKIWFQEKYWADTLFEFTSQNWDLWEIKQLLYAGSLFVSKKMVILYWVPRDTYENNSLMADKIDKFLEDFQQNMSLLTSDTILILVSYKPDKRTKAFKWFSEQLQLKEFTPYKESQLKGFIREQLVGFQIGEPEVDILLLKVKRYVSPREWNWKIKNLTTDKVRGSGFYWCYSSVLFLIDWMRCIWDFWSFVEWP